MFQNDLKMKPLNSDLTLKKIPAFSTGIKVCRTHTYHHRGVHSLKSHHKVPYMDCTVDSHGIRLRFHVHTPIFS